MRSLVRKLRANKKLRKVLTVACWAVLAFIVLNLVIALVFRGRTYPGTVILNQKVGAKTRNGLVEKISNSSYLPASIKLVYEDKTVDIKPAELGVEVDAIRTANEALKHRSWLPIWNFIKPPKEDVFLKTNEDILKNQVVRLTDTFKKDPVNARIVLENGKFVIKNEANGYQLDQSQLVGVIQQGINQQKNTITVPIAVTQPQVKHPELSATAKDLEERQNVSVIYKFSDKTRKLTTAEIADLHEPNGSLYVLSETKLKDFIVKIGGSFGIGVANINEAVRDSKSAIQNKKPLEFTFKEAPRKTYTYCVSLRGVDASELSGFQNKLAAALADARGWSVDNKVSFVRVESGCNFRVWLSAASQMSSFGAICDADWSCAVSPNVIINYDRWRFASAAWNQSGGNLDDYRSMVINHEVGHWLGFGHYNCGGAGQLAPVMQQQSINLQGCKFNPWPLASERESLKRMVGI